MSRFTKVLPVKVSATKNAKGDVAAYELEYKLREGLADYGEIEMSPEDATDYLRNSAGLRFPWFVEGAVTWDTPEQGEFNSNLIIGLFKSGHIVAKRGGSKTTKLGDTTFIDPVVTGFTLDFKS